MEKKLLFAIAFMTIMVVSCSKDNDEDTFNPEDLPGTTWKCFDGLDTDTEYATLKFITTSVVEGWTKMKNESEGKDWTGSYTINGNDITVSYSSHSFTGTFDGKNLTVSISGIPLVFKKQ